METNIYKKASYLEIFVIILQPVVHQHVQWILISGKTNCASLAQEQGAYVIKLSYDIKRTGIENVGVQELQ